MLRKPINFTFPLQFSFLVFSMLLNCMGIVILKFSSSGVSYGGLGLLEFFKDLPIAIMSFFAVSFINMHGTKNTLIYSMVLVSISCFILPFINEFWFFKIWFALIGIGFSAAKIAVFSIIRSNSTNEKQLSKIMNRVEATFMIGIFVVNIGFGWLLESKHSEFWTFGFWIISLLALINIFVLRKTEISEFKIENTSNFISGFKDVFTRRSIIFFAIIFFIVFLEQTFNSWLPTFYKTHLQTNSFVALQASAFMALFSFFGRVLTSKIIASFKWNYYVFTCLGFIIGLLVIAQIFVLGRFSPTILFILFPLLGLFIAPLYPLYNSKHLIKIEKEKVNVLVSIIIIFSSLGSSFGSLFMALIFHFNFGNYYTLFTAIPVVIILTITIIFFKTIVSKRENS